MGLREKITNKTKYNDTIWQDIRDFVLELMDGLIAVAVWLLILLCIVYLKR